MKIKVSIQIIFKIMIIVLMIIYLPSYSHQNVKVFKAISTTEALQTSVRLHLIKKYTFIIPIKEKSMLDIM